MKTCILHVTDHEYDQILQLNHDALVWSNRDNVLLDGLRALIGTEVVEQIRQYDECKMLKHDKLDGLRRVEPCPGQPVRNPPVNVLAGESVREEVAGCPTGLVGTIR